METKLAKIAQVAKEKPKEQFTSLVHLLSVEMLLRCHQELSGNKAAGIDEVTKAEYEENLTENIKKLIYLHDSINYFHILNNSMLGDKCPSYDGLVNGVFAVKS